MPNDNHNNTNDNIIVKKAERQKAEEVEKRVVARLPMKKRKLEEMIAALEEDRTPAKEEAIERLKVRLQL